MRVEEAVVDAGWTALPELHRFGNDAVSAPEGGDGYFTILEPAFDFFDLLEQDFAGGYDFGLVRYPGSDLGFPGSGGEVS